MSCNSTQVSENVSVEGLRSNALSRPKGGSQKNAYDIYSNQTIGYALAKDDKKFIIKP